MKLLVTGTSGFVGTSFCERFGRTESFDILGVDRRPPREQFASVEYVTGDLTDPSFVNRTILDFQPEAIVHLAAQARVDPSLVKASPTYIDNVVATVNLIAASEGLGHNLSRFVYASSETVYGSSTEYPSRETSVLNPQSPYAASKAACELLICRALPTRALILRSGMGYGPRSDPRAQVVGRFITQALGSEPILFPRDDPPEGHPTRDVNHVGNFLDGLESALRAGVTGTFNVASGREISILNLANEVVTSVGRGTILRSADFQYRPGEVGARTWLDITKAQDAFGYVPRIDLESGLRASVAWYRTHTDYFSQREGSSLNVPA